MISILFHITVKAGKETEFHDLAVRLTDVTRAEDDGCLTYVYLRQQTQTNTFSTSSGETKQPWTPIWHTSKH